MRAVTVDDIYLGRDRAAASLVIQRVGPPGNPDAKLERRLLRMVGQRLADAFP